MKVLYLSSGYPRIYQFFDECILNEFHKLPDVEVKFYKLIEQPGPFISLCEQFQPDIVLTMLGDRLPKKSLEWIKHHNFHSILWLTEDPYFTDRSIEIIPFFDVVFSIDIGAVNYYKSLGYQNIYHLPLGTDPAVFFPKPHIQKTNDICFIGHSYPERIRLVQLLLNETAFHIQVIGKWKKKLFYKPTKKLNIINSWIHPLKVADYYSNAKIVLNTHRSYNYKTNQNSAGIVNQSINNRTFDIAACGSFQLIQWIDDLPQHFEENKEIVSFKSDEDFLNKVNYYLSNDEERELIAANGRKKALMNHTFNHRINKMLEIVKEILHY
ncbi:CgeB family protein [Scopulibacillus cellulosilyticus]|uniref:Glycosyltransferase n=1 Tax=Scopulibacillus cellulosilyticus TaxID=2665665 RepID=A0ABW2Q075_9BACL